MLPIFVCMDDLLRILCGVGLQVFGVLVMRKGTRSPTSAQGPRSSLLAAGLVLLLAQVSPGKGGCLGQQSWPAKPTLCT
jgi:hypothetical protein